MSKPRTEAEFVSQITEDRSWRFREISDFKNAVSKADGTLQRALLRGLLPICYAHFEGYVRFAARKYLEYIALRKFKYKEIDRQFVRNHFLPKLAAVSATKVSVAERCSLIDEILSGLELRFSRVDSEIVNTKSNLNFDVLSDICTICCVPKATFEDRATFVDLFLLKRRNEIAHGQETFVEVKDLNDLTNETISLMRAFGDALENQVCLKHYKAHQHSPTSPLTHVPPRARAPLRESRPPHAH